jgi:hypothetical protein
MDAGAMAVSEAAGVLVAMKHCYDDRRDDSCSDDTDDDNSGGDNSDDDRGGDNKHGYALCKQRADGVVAADEAAPVPLQIFQIINTSK